MIYVRDIEHSKLIDLLEHYGLRLVIVPKSMPLPGSFWGDSEAGLIDNLVFVQDETPLHSMLHETCHYICMDEQRRNGLHTNAGGDFDEENAVCYLQILLAEGLHPLNKQGLMADMDAWGYSFRLGSAEKWFFQDATDAYDWLRRYDLITDEHEKPTWKLREIQ